MHPDTGRAVTVSGPIAAEHLGVTLTHEHLFLDLQGIRDVHPDAEVAKELEGSIRVEMLGYLRRFWRWNHDNNLLDDEDVAVEEILRFKRLGGATVCDLTPIANRVPGQAEKLRIVAERTGVNVIAGTGQYVQKYHDASVESLSAGALADVFQGELTVGIEGTDVRAGVIGEIGLSHPVHPDEERVLEAAGLAHLATGAPIIIHKEIDDPVPLWAIDRLSALGVDPARILLSHVGDNVPIEPIIAAMRRGANVGMDNFGIEGYWNEIEFPTDGDTVRKTVRLLEAGFETQVLLSQDVCHKHMLRRFGGYGYDHILRDIHPMLTRAGVDEDTYETLMVRNPARLLPWGV